MLAFSAIDHNINSQSLGWTVSSTLCSTAQSDGASVRMRKASVSLPCCAPKIKSQPKFWYEILHYVLRYGILKSVRGENFLRKCEVVWAIIFIFCHYAGDVSPAASALSDRGFKPPVNLLVHFLCDTSRQEGEVSLGMPWLKSVSKFTESQMGSNEKTKGTIRKLKRQLHCTHTCLAGGAREYR